MKIVIGISGASGIIYGIRLLEVLQKLDVETHLVMSEWAIRNLEFETDHTLEQVQALASRCYSNSDMAAAIASGSFRTDGMVIAPCSMKSLSAIAHGYSDSLIVRAADVMLKERRKLVLLPRETPLSTIHLNNMLAITQAGAIVMPPMPAFYSRPRTLDDVINHTIGRVLDHFGLEKHGLFKRWEPVCSENFNPHHT